MYKPADILALLDEMDVAHARASAPHPDLNVGERLDLWRGYAQACANRFAIVAQAYRELAATPTKQERSQP